MKISGANIAASEAAARTYQSQNSAAARTKESGTSRRFDSVMLTGAGGARSSFEMELRSRISHEVRTATTSGQVAALREQVQRGEYKIDAREIAKKMLLTEAV